LKGSKIKKNVKLASKAPILSDSTARFDLEAERTRKYVSISNLIATPLSGKIGAIEASF
jgi:hypothetical protein